MHGAIFAELERFAVGSIGADFWKQMLDSAGLGARVYLPVATYPDEEALALVGAASQLSGKSAAEILTSFGEHLAPPLLDMYGSLLRPTWRTLDLLEHTETTIHRIVRQREPDATPPELTCERTSDQEVVITYRSPRRLCALAIGLARGVARHYAESIEIQERECMHRGAPHCVIRLRLAAAQPS